MGVENMAVVARLAAVLVGVFGIALGLWFYTMTQQAAAAFFVTPQGAGGLATLRADMSAFFLIGGVFALHAVWSGRGASLLVPMALYAVALSGRAVNLIAAGAYEGAFTPMLVEAVLIGLCAVGWRVLQPKMPS